ncbi:MAG: bifunctional metallophosphatase/5'-nucleotidase [Novibacillus thermophilus]
MRKRHIRILHTNDIHSHLDRTPQITSVIQSMRQQFQKRGDVVVTVDVGDHMDRRRVETEGTNGQVNVAIMNETGYDYVTLGNNEGLTFPHHVLERMYDKASFQVILSNWLDLQTKKRPEWMVPWVVREWFGCRVAFTAVTAPFNDFYRLLGWVVTDPVEVLQRVVSKLRYDSRADIVVLLSHLGLQYDRVLAEKVPGIDVILGGHTHHLLETVVQHHGTFLAATGKFGEYVGEVSLTVDAETGRLLDVSGTCHAVEEAAPAENIVQLLKDYSQQADRQLAQAVIRLKKDLPLDWRGESPFGNLLADSLLNKVEADVAVVNTGQLLEGLSSGVVTRKDLHRICPSPINPCRILLRGKHLRRALEESLLDEFQELPIQGFGFRGKQLGNLAVAGMHVVYRPDAPTYEKIVDIRIGDHSVEDRKRYRVSTIDMFTFGIGYASLKEGDDVEFFLPDFLRDLLAKQLQRAEHIEAAFRKRWYRLDELAERKAVSAKST